MHIAFAVVTISPFNIRFFLLLSKPEKPLAGIWKVLPHLNNMISLFAGLWLMKVIRLIPFGNANWLGVKILLPLVYVGLGVVMVRTRPHSPKFFITYLLAAACVGSIVYLTMHKPF